MSRLWRALGKHHHRYLTGTASQTWSVVCFADSGCYCWGENPRRKHVDLCLLQAVESFAAPARVEQAAAIAWRYPPPKEAQAKHQVRGLHPPVPLD